MAAQKPSPLKPLAISCTSTDCQNDLHCFRQKKRQGMSRRAGPCRSCGADLVEWGRVQKRDGGDVQYTFESLKKELVRHVFWHRAFDQKAMNHARRKGRVLLRGAADVRIRSAVGRARNVREGQQTPYSGNVLYYAQHATASCCRRCIEYWHGIEFGRPLAEEEVAYLVDLIMRYIDCRLPELKDEPEKVPAIRDRHPRTEKGR